MQQLLAASSLTQPDDVCAQALLDTVPLVIRIIREQMRRHRSGLTIAQFRTLCFISTSEGNSLSAVADFIGLSLPAMSRLVDGLVEQRLMERRPCDDDRRHVRLSVTVSGKAALDEAREMAQAHLAKALSQLTPKQRTTVVSAMKTLRTVFTPEVGCDGPSIADSHDLEKTSR
jgi:DNA-binding MarR family transcriptional regulator